MLNLLYLTKKINDFYQTASSLGFQRNAGWSADGKTYIADDDDEEPITERKPKSVDNIYLEIMGLLKSISDPEIRENVIITLDMYRQAMQMHDGFNRLLKSIDSTISSIGGSDIDVSEKEEETLDQLKDMFVDMSEEIDGLANKGTGDSEQAINELKKVRREYTPAALNTIIQETAPVVVDNTGGVGPEGNRGMGMAGKAKVDYSQRYAKEREYYAKKLNSINDPKAKAKLQKIVEVLEKLILTTAQEYEAYSQFVNNPTAELQDKQKELKSKIKELRKENTVAKQGFRNYLLQENQKEIVKKLDEISKSNPISISEIEKNPTLLFKNYNKAKYLAHQTLELNKSLLSLNQKKGEATVLRKAIIAFLPGMAPNEEGLNKLRNLLHQLKEAELKIVPIQEVWRQQGDILRDVKKNWIGYERGHEEVKMDSHDFQRAFRSLIQHLPNVKMGDKKEVIDKWREAVIIKANEQERTKFGPYLDAVAAERAANKGKITKANTSMQALFKALNTHVDEFEEKISRINWRMARIEETYKDVQKLIHTIRNLSHNNNVFSRQKKGAGVTDIDIKPNLNREEHSILISLASEADRLAEQNYPNPFGANKERISTKGILGEIRDVMMFHARKPITKETANPQASTKVKVEITDEETGLVEYKEMTMEEASKPIPGKEIVIIGEYMSKKLRKKAFAKLTKQAFVDTSVNTEIAELLADPSLNAIEDDKEYAHKVFQKMLASLDEKMKKISE